MSLVRIVLGAIIGAATLAAALLGASYLHLHLASVALGWCVLVGLIFDRFIARKSRLALAPYWKRKCTGSSWKRHFPDSSKQSIRVFLDLFVLAFLFPNRQLSFSPDDRVMDIYRALYPDRSVPDGCELEMLVDLFQKRYGVDLASHWHEDVTLGDLYAQARRAGSSPSSNDGNLLSL